MSHHLDGPVSREDVRLDITDLYLFRGERGTVFAMDVNHSSAPQVTGRQDPPGCHPQAQYEFKIDTDRDAIEDLTYRVTFGELDPTGQQTVELRRLTGADAVSADATGEVLASGVTGETITTAGGLRLWAGKATDPFWIDGTVLEAIGHAFTDGTRVDLSGWQPSQAANKFAGQSVYAIVLEIPDSQLLPFAPRDRRIAVWARTNLSTEDGWRQINRFGHPMIHMLFTQFNSELGNHLNASQPADDIAKHGKAIMSAVAAVVSAYGSAQDPQSYAADVAARLLPDMLPYTIGTAAVYGFNGFNGRTLIDNVPDVMLSLATNTAFSTGLTKDASTAKPSSHFPYLPPG